MISRKLKVEPLPRTQLFWTSKKPNLIIVLLGWTNFDNHLLNDEYQQSDSPTYKLFRLHLVENILRR